MNGFSAGGLLRLRIERQERAAILRRTKPGLILSSAIFTYYYDRLTFGQSGRHVSHLLFAMI